MSVDDTFIGGNFREDMALVAYRQGRVLVLRMHGYLSRDWRVPQGVILNDVDYRQRARQLLAELVHCADVGEVRDAKVTARVDYPSEQRNSNDPRVTSRVYDGKDLRFYTAEMLCPEELLEPAGRVKDFKMIEPARLARFLSPEEAFAVEKILKTYVIDV